VGSKVCEKAESTNRRATVVCSVDYFLCYKFHEFLQLYIAITGTEAQSRADYRIVSEFGRIR
jgi:hypothetical protein